MFQATNDYLDSQSTVWNTIPIIGTYKNQLATTIDGIKESAKDQADAQVFVGKSVKAFKRTISEKMDMLDDLLEAYALDTDNAELAAKAANTQTDYYSLSYEDFEVKVKQVIGLLETYAGEMSDYGMTTQQIDDVKIDLDQFLAVRGKPRAYQIASSTATKSLEELFDSGREATEKLDRVLKRFKRANASFYNGYIAARKIVDD